MALSVTLGVVSVCSESCKEFCPSVKHNWWPFLLEYIYFLLKKNSSQFVSKQDNQEKKVS